MSDDKSNKDITVGVVISPTKVELNTDGFLGKRLLEKEQGVVSLQAKLIEDQITSEQLGEIEDQILANNLRNSLGALNAFLKVSELIRKESACCKIKKMICELETLGSDILPREVLISMMEKESDETE